ncbi:unnamed protein product [Caenorhabditis angaria]|uniref:Uncharacterized protein n=1 Tax=Caenorhabditis angaria TaxID=860376 RepID=A0A9P1IZT8_9PELO|nr:unnamed protein product [Caenorhabditis angaria]
MSLLFWNIYLILTKNIGIRHDDCSELLSPAAEDQIDEEVRIEEHQRFGRQRYIKHLISSRNSRRTFERKSYGTSTEAHVEKENCSKNQKTPEYSSLRCPKI